MGKKLDDMTADERYDHYCNLWESWIDRNIDGPCHAVASINHGPTERSYLGSCILHLPADDFFGGKESREYTSRILHNPTWGTVFKHFNEAIKVTGDYHHCFLEGVRVLRTLKDGVAIVEFCTGS